MFDFAIIGAQRSGSTRLARCIGEHPNVWMPKAEVMTFEDAYFDSVSVARLEQMLASAKRGQLVGIKCPNYLGRPECPGRLHQFAPKAKTIATLRNPIDRAISAYYHYMKIGRLPVAPIEVGLPRLLDVESGDSFPGIADVLEFGMYARHLRRYLSVYSRDRILILSDATPYDTARLREVYQFLGLDPTYCPRSLKKKANEGVYSLPRIRFIRMRNSCVFSPDLMHRRTGMRAWLVNVAVMGTDRTILLALFGNQMPPVSRTLRWRLYERYRHDIDELENLIAQDLSAWRL
jgi:Sulfotransferase domain